MRHGYVNDEAHLTVSPSAMWQFLWLHLSCARITNVTARPLSNLTAFSAKDFSGGVEPLHSMTRESRNWEQQTL
jgi:hypothetical protein